MQAIQTSFVPCTNTKPSRIKAECQAGKIIIPWNVGLNSEDNHTVACQELLSKLGWCWYFSSGQLRDGSYVHILTKSWVIK